MNNTFRKIFDYFWRKRCHNNPYQNSSVVFSKVHLRFSLLRALLLTGVRLRQILVKIMFRIPRSHQSLHMFKSCFYKLVLLNYDENIQMKLLFCTRKRPFWKEISDFIRAAGYEDREEDAYKRRIYTLVAAYCSYKDECKQTVEAGVLRRRR